MVTTVLMLPAVIILLASPVRSQDRRDDDLSAMQESIPGEPGVDYPIYSVAPVTKFSCGGKTNGYYADTLTGCQSFHVCGFSASVFDSIKYTFLCPNGSVFNQEMLICDWWYKVDCSLAESYYTINDNIPAFSDVQEKGDKPYQELPARELTRTQIRSEPVGRKNGGSFGRLASSPGLYNSSPKKEKSYGSSSLFPGRLTKFPNFDVLTPSTKRKSRSENGDEAEEEKVEEEDDWGGRWARTDDELAMIYQNLSPVEDVSRMSRMSPVEDVRGVGGNSLQADGSQRHLNLKKIHFLD